MIISRTEFIACCNVLDSVSGTMSVKHCTEQDAARLFPSDEFMEYLRWLDYFNALMVDDTDHAIAPIETRFENGVNEVVTLLDPDGKLYLPEYRTFLEHPHHIRLAIHQYFGKVWLMESQILEAIRRKRQHWHE